MQYTSPASVITGLKHRYIELLMFREVL